MKRADDKRVVTLNRARVLRTRKRKAIKLLEQGRGRNRAAVARATGLSYPTVTRLAKDFWERRRREREEERLRAEAAEGELVALLARHADALPRLLLAFCQEEITSRPATEILRMLVGTVPFKSTVVQWAPGFWSALLNGVRALDAETQEAGGA